jgi:hypothetical protein
MPFEYEVRAVELNQLDHKFLRKYRYPFRYVGPSQNKHENEVDAPRLVTKGNR